MQETVTTPITQKQLIIHIGDPKTGTTTIQSVLHNGLVNCESKQILPWKKLNAIALANSLKPSGKDDRKEQFQSVKEWLSNGNGDIAIISSEFFSSIRPKVLHKALLNHLPEHIAENAKIIAYVRPHASRFIAAYIQRTKTGQFYGDVDDFLHSLQKNEPLTFSYAKRFGRWKNQFGGNFSLKPFIRSELIDGDISKDFFSDVLDGAPFHTAGLVEANVSVTTKALAGIRIVQENFKNLGLEAKSRSLLGGALANHFLSERDNSGDKPKLDKNTAEKLVSSYLDDAKNLDNLFFDRPLMQEALERCVDEAVDEKIDLTPENHFATNEIEALTEKSAMIFSALKKSGKTWAANHHSRTRNISLSHSQMSKIEKNSKVIGEIDDSMSDIAEILTRQKI
ncbi:hypothetical protein [Salipiger sp. CCB-MM3]|uniref:hypothetical protein n=1 Tax=Salipiger sp. CCB-MM3 TaxID=1792508 RepID=UPI0012FB0B7B|nr:hypothetical protein [Salipiger sp. CCB-MM3]